MKSSVALLIFLASIPIVFGQSEAEPLYTDEIEHVLCDELKARLDALMIVVYKNPGSFGVIAIAQQADPLKSIDLESLVTGAMFDRSFDMSRLKIVRSAPSKRSAMRLWAFPAGTQLSDIESKAWDLSLALMKPVMFYANNGMFDGIYSTGSLNEHFSELLAANPDCRGNIVLREPTQAKFRKKRTEVLNRLGSMDQKRLRFFYVRSKYPEFEYWLVPPNRK